MRNLNELKVLIVGLGQIGGSIGIDLVARNLVARVTGYDIDPDIAQRAVNRKIVHGAVSSLEDGVRNSDLVILAAPIREIIKMMPRVCEVIDDSAAIMDMAGTKTEILKTVSRCGRPINYIGGHPMAGNENSGLQAVQRQKFRGRMFVLTQHDGSDSNEWLYTIMHLVTKIGGRPIVLSSEEHDKLIALTSHLPYLFALTLTRMAADRGETNCNVWNLAAGSFKSATRVAGSSTDLTLDMFLTNRANIGAVVDEMVADLMNLKRMIEAGDESSLKIMINDITSKARAARY